MEYRNKIIAFVDILGFKRMVTESESDKGRSLTELLSLLEKLGSPEAKRGIVEHGPTFCPRSQRIHPDLDYQVTQISDCVIISAEDSPSGLLQVVSHCWASAFKLLHEGVLCRGFITRGPIFHTDNQVIGSGYTEAYLNERKVSFLRRDEDTGGTPFVEIDKGLVDYVRTCGDPCVVEMFSRHTKTHGGVTAIYPFQVLSHSFVVSDLDAEKEKAANNRVRQTILRLRNRISAELGKSEPQGDEKIGHYVAVLDEQLAICAKTDQVIELLVSPFPRQTFMDSSNGR